MWKKGEIGVRTENRSDEDKNHIIGTIYESERDDEIHLYYEGGYSNTCFRKATPIEIEAYHNGIRHIDDIPKSKDLFINLL